MSYAGTAIKAYKTAMALKAMVNTEKKLQLINGLAQPVFITGTIYPLMAHSQGTGLGNRIGNTIRLKSYQLRCEVAPATGAPSRLRVMVVQDLDCKVDGFGAMKLKSEFVKKLNSRH